MAVEDFLIFGIPASLLISLASALIAILAIYYANKSTKISHDQYILAQKLIERPRVLENIQTLINPLILELENEISSIDNKDLAWIDPNEVGNLYARPLIFPISQSKIFFRRFQDIFYTPDLLRDPRLSILVDSAIEGIQERCSLYQELENSLNQFTNEIEGSHFDNRIADLLIDTDYRITALQPEPVRMSENLGSISIGVLERNTITRSRVNSLIKSLIISTLFKPLEENDLRLIWVGETDLSTRLYGKILSHTISDPIPTSDETRQFVENTLASLRGLNVTTLITLESLKRVYREIYSYKESELNPPQGMI
ncbi:hypothetical protein [uncultured Methanoregula sp.]|uniref:hypothetical protein n=1 Tax=uncultured Methanoregula sp. TaxID=1005933 RepID=UPI002AAB8585|nr:hypothetical protein [uncultured Methanoregula sp.]